MRDDAMEFVAMKSIEKKTSNWSDNCTDWVATEKVHGSSFQFYTSDGFNIQVASRRRPLDKDGSFLKCNINNLLRKNETYIKRLWEMVVNGEKWKAYREIFCVENDAEDAEEGNDGVDEEEIKEEDESDGQAGSISYNNEHTKDTTPVNTDDSHQIHLRIYGELYGGGGIEKDVKSAVQKEIIYSDEFRFYVFAITINRKWVTVSELNELCCGAGFPYYAMPMCEPKPTVDELKEWLVENNFMNSRSRLTDRTDNNKTYIEGVVMTPLTRKDFRLHAVKFLADAFNDVRAAQNPKNTDKNKNGKTPKKLNYCTKARYHSVISKLDIPEREQTDLVADMFIADILKESADDQVTNKQKKIWRSVVVNWLREDGYHGCTKTTTARESEAATSPEIGHEEENEDGDDLLSAMFS